LSIGCTHSQTNNSLPGFTGNIAADLKMLLPEGKHLADMMDGVKQNPRQASLSKKLQDSIQANYEWFADFLKTVPDGEPMPYHPKLGITQEEYEELMSYFKNIEIVSTGKENITIEIKNDTIYFKSRGKMADLDSLRIDLKNNTVYYGAYMMPFSDSLNIKTDKNGLRSKWKGYTWIYEEPKDLELDDLKDLSNLQMKQYKLTVGRLEKNGKTYMSLKGREIEDGAKTVEFELPVMF
jgi:hypothetical protein